MKNNQEKINEIWNFLSKTYFLPLFYLFFVFLLWLLIILYNLEDFGGLEFLFSSAFLMPNGIFYFIFILTGKKVTEKIISIYPYFFFAFLLASIIAIRYFKLKKKIIIKWLIILSMLIITLSFAGCFAGMITESEYVILDPFSLF